MYHGCPGCNSITAMTRNNLWMCLEVMECAKAAVAWTWNRQTMFHSCEILCLGYVCAVGNHCRKASPSTRRTGVEAESCRWNSFQFSQRMSESVVKDEHVLFTSFCWRCKTNIVFQWNDLTVGVDHVLQGTVVWVDVVVRNGNREKADDCVSIIDEPIPFSWSSI